MRTPRAGTLSTNLAVGTAAAEEMLHTRMTSTIVLPEGALVTDNEVNRPMVSVVKGLGINMAMLPQEMLYVLQDRVIVEIWAREGHTLQVMSEQ